MTDFAGVQGAATPDNSVPLADILPAANVSGWGNLMPTRAQLESAGEGMTPMFQEQLARLRSLDADCAKAWAALDSLDWAGDEKGATQAVWAGRQAYGWSLERIAQKYGFTGEQIKAHFAKFGFNQ